MVNQQTPGNTGLPSSPSPSEASGVRVLVVDDSRVNLKVAAAMFRKLGYECDLAENGAEALAAWQSRRYELIFMDCYMPVMDGFKATAEIRKAEAAAETGAGRTPVIALTASVLAEDRQLCHAAGMDDFVTKPINLAQLREVLSRWLPAAGKSG